MYHRVAEVEIDPWRLSVSPSQFDDQLDYLSHEMELVPLSDIHIASQTGRPKVAITFDDGYRDNFEFAFPSLERRGIPATFFVVSRTVGEKREFWWDELEHIVLNSVDLPSRVSLSSTHGAFQHQLGSATLYNFEQQQLDREIEVFDAAVGTRLHFFRELWDFLCGCPHDERETLLDELWLWSGRNPVSRDSYIPMNALELQAIDRSPLMEIGAHTVTHPRLPSLEGQEKKVEILEGAKQLWSLTNREPKAFSYPFGQWDRESLEIVESAFDYAVITKPKCITADTPRHRLNRFAVENWSKDEFHSRIALWSHQAD